MEHTFSVYILASRSRSLYTGVTNDLERRMTEHRQGVIPGFTTRYRVFRLVHVELFGHINDAIAREKEIKGWRREKKIHLIEQHNPTWEDLAARLPHHYQSFQHQNQIPPRSPKSGDHVRDNNPHVSFRDKTHVSFRTK
ncbi:MAG: GIY-YIG nuclease family protein [Acidobacteriia bacterium]|nr:GIY-YIG nuclease family protein [Terriglobia bacterium]